MSLERTGSAVMETAREPPPGKEPVMRAFRRAAVLVLLGLILGAPWAVALEARPERVPHEATSALDLFHSFGSLLARAWNKAGCALGGCAAGAEAGAQTPTSKEGCAGDPLGGCTPGH